MLVPMRAILAAADKYRYGQGAFNMNSVGQIEAAVRIHELLHSGAILQGAEASNAFMGGELDFMHGTIEAKKVGAKRIGDAVKRYGENSPVPIALHLDHGKSIESVKACIDGGYTSVMIDGSSLPYEQNVELTREVVKLAHPYGVTVEGELGVLAGVEDHVFSATSTYTNPMQAVDFFKKTGCDALAISYGTCHGANKGKDTKIRREIAIATKECMLHEGIDGYLVSHGSSTVPQEYVQASTRSAASWKTRSASMWRSWWMWRAAALTRSMWTRIFVWPARAICWSCLKRSRSSSRALLSVSSTRI